MRRYTGIVFSNNGAIQPNVPVQVVITGTTTLATLYADDEITPIGNPVTTDDAGQFTFKVISGVFDFLDQDSNPIQESVQIFDFKNPGEWVGLWSFPNTGFQFGSDGIRNVYTASDDQIGFDSGIRVGGLQQASPAAMLIGSGSGSDFLQSFRTLGSPNYAFAINENGEPTWGPDASAGGFTGSVSIRRTGNTQLTLDAGLIVNAALFQHKGFAVGFYGNDAILRPQVVGGILDNINDAALISLLNGLADLGLINYATTIAAGGIAGIVVNGTLSAIVSRDSSSGVVVGATGSAVVTGSGEVDTIAGAAIIVGASGTATVS
jgi:hypothetical protein